LRILDGENVSDIPITNSEEILRPVFDWRQLQRWGISENRLPARFHFGLAAAPVFVEQTCDQDGLDHQRG
jgi:hypothetical protein